MSITELIGYLMPIIVWGVTEGMKWVLPKIPSWSVLAIVAILSAIAGWITTLITPETTWVLQFLYSLLAVTFNEIIKMLKGIGAKPTA